MAKSAGEIAKTINIEVQKVKVKAAEAIVKGNLVSFDANGDLINSLAASTIHEGLFVALETTTGGECNIARPSTYVYMTAGGTIVPFKLVTRGADQTTVVTHNTPADAATPTAAEVNAIKNGYAKAAGRYVGKEGSTAAIGNAANTDVVIVRLGF